MQQGQPGVKNTLFVPPNNYPIRAFGALLDMLPNKVQPVYYSHSYPFDLLSVKKTSNLKCIVELYRILHSV